MNPRAELAVIAHADVLGSTRLVQADERLAHGRITETFRRFAATIVAYGGQTHEIRGDALVARFDRASDAVCAALAYQAENTARAQATSDGDMPCVRIGIAIGEVVIADGTVTGAGVVLAQRVEQLADAHGVCITAAIREALPARLSLVCKDLGEQALKGFEERVRVWAVSVADGEGVPPPELPHSPPAGRRLLVQYGLIGAAVLALAAAISVALIPEPRSDTVMRPVPAVLDGHAADAGTIAVLPFTNASDDPGQAYFSDGISEDINTDLTRLPGVRVIPMATARRLGPRASNLAAAAHELQVRYLLAGSVRREGDKLRISARLYDASEARQIWAERYDRDARDLFAIQDDIASQVVRALSDTLGVALGSRAVRAHTPDLEAYDLYIQGRARRIPPTPVNLAAAVDLFNGAIARDANFAGGYAGVAFVSVLRYGNCAVDCAHLLEDAQVMARKAVALDPAFGPAHGTLAEAYFRGRRFDEALAAIEEAVRLAPGDSLMLATRGRIRGHTGDLDGGTDDIKQALRMSPDSLPLLFYLGANQRIAGQYSKAVKTLVEHRTRLAGRVLPAPATQLAAAYEQAGRRDDAQRTVSEVLAVAPDYSVAQVARTHPLKFAADATRLGAALRAAGLPAGVQ